MRNPDTGEAESAADRVYALVRQRIISGEYQPNTLLSEAQIAADAGLSRTPVRQALHVLQAERWLRVFPRKGVLILTPQVMDVHDFYELRLVLETWGIRKLAGRRLSAKVMSGLRSALQACQDAVESDETTFHRLAVRFHELIFMASENVLFVEIITWLRQRQYWDGKSYVEVTPAPYKERLQILKVYERLLNAVETGNADLACEILVEINNMPLKSGGGLTPIRNGASTRST
jgi:DNA-binding GntR family transcriptional regulator